MIKWWGYLHENGTLHVKRFFDMEDIFEAESSPFVDRVYGPWEADSRDGAIEKLKRCVHG